VEREKGKEKREKGKEGRGKANRERELGSGPRRVHQPDALARQFIMSQLARLPLPKRQSRGAVYHASAGRLRGPSELQG